METGRAKAIFTGRELEILRLLVEEGLNTKEAAGARHCTESTIKQCCHRMYEKIQNFLGYRQPIDRVGLALFAVTHELVNMRTVIDRYSPVRLESPTSATRIPDGGPAPGTASLRATAS
jgi:predicted DNA-binding protein (UPF0251 family)